MKTLEELGISPTPWCVTKHYLAGGDEVYSINSRSGIVSEADEQDAHLIAAAPKLYEALREAVIERCCFCKSCSGHPGYKCENKESQCYGKRWHAILAEASGDVEKRGINVLKIGSIED